MTGNSELTLYCGRRRWKILAAAVTGSTFVFLLLEQQGKICVTYHAFLLRSTSFAPSSKKKRIVVSRHVGGNGKQCGLASLALTAHPLSGFCGPLFWKEGTHHYERFPNTLFWPIIRRLRSYRSIVPPRILLGSAWEETILARSARANLCSYRSWKPNHNGFNCTNLERARRVRAERVHISFLTWYLAFPFMG